MKRVAIITIQSSNYGNRLQNYALQNIISNFGLIVETIPRTTSHKSIIFIIKLLVQRLMRTRGYFFYEFDKNIIKSKYYALSDVFEEGLAEKYDYFISGSDQVWNPYFPFVGSVDLLFFANKEQKISYAASFGINQLPDGMKQKYKEALSDFHKISVREESAANIIQELIGITPDVVLDPTLLLNANEWRKISRKPRYMPDRSYTMVYSLGEKNKEFEEESRKEGCFDILQRRNGNTLPIGPAEFIYLIDHAEQILTDSFHATVFSLIFQKPCKTFRRTGLDMNSRIIHLANICGISDLINCNGTLIIDQRINYNLVEDRLENERRKSLLFLKEALSQ